MLNSLCFVTDMINMLKLGYIPSCCGWIYTSGDPMAALAM